MDYLKIYESLILRARLLKSKRLTLHHLGELYVERHHVEPRAHGGEDGETNLVPLTAREHYIAHRLLAKIHPDCKDMARAVFFMACLQTKPIPSRAYSRLRSLSILANSGLSNYGAKPARIRCAITGRFIATYVSITAWARVHGYDASNLRKCARGTRKHHKGLTAEYIK